MPTNKIAMDESLVRRLVAAQFPRWADLPIKRVEPHGWDNYTFHLGENRTVRLPITQAFPAVAPTGR